MSLTAWMSQSCTTGDVKTIKVWGLFYFVEVLYVCALSTPSCSVEMHRVFFVCVYKNSIFSDETKVQRFAFPSAANEPSMERMTKQVECVLLIFFFGRGVAVKHRAW